jgi:cytochrome c-type biogenesis protein CcmH
MLPRCTARYLAFSLVLLAALLVLGTGTVAADNGVTDDQVNEVSKDIYCPVCENVPLDVCPTQACADWRDLVRQKLEQGFTKEEIIDELARQYGEQVRARPATTGFSLFIWLMPVLAVLGGAVYFGRYLRSLKHSAAASDRVEAPSSKKAPPATDDYRTKIEKELEDWE